MMHIYKIQKYLHIFEDIVMYSVDMTKPVLLNLTQTTIFKNVFTKLLTYIALHLN